MRTDYDVIIVGAGLVGLVLASLLAKHDMQIAIVEAGQLEPISPKDDQFELRVSAINATCKTLFSELNIWEKIRETKRFAPFEKMFVWDSLGKGEIHFDCTEIAAPNLGYIIENAVIQNALLEELRNYRNVQIFSNSQPLCFNMANNKILLQFKDKDLSIRAQLIVGADGARSWVREEAHIESYVWPYLHNAFVATVETEYSHQKTAWQCFLPDGPLALLPLFEKNICSIVWSAPPDEIKRLERMDNETFNFEITNAFENRLGKIKKISDHATFPLMMRHVKNYVTERIALVGDAAHTIHPLAGQGVNIGFADACALAEIIIEAHRNHHDVGDYLTLRKYERARKSDNWMMIFGMEFFKRLFESESFVTIWLRSLGLLMVNKVNMIKNQFIYKAIGRSSK